MAEPNLELLQHLVQQVLDEVRGARADIRSNTTRIGELEVTVARQSVQLAEMSVRIDRFGDRLDRIERRLGLADASA